MLCHDLTHLAVIKNKKGIDMSDVKMSAENIEYLLITLAGFEPEDIECDDFEVAVNDDQFAQMSIIRTAELAKELIAKLQADNELLRELLSEVMHDECGAEQHLGETTCDMIKLALAATAKG